MGIATAENSDKTPFCLLSACPLGATSHVVHGRNMKLMCLGCKLHGKANSLFETFS